MNTTNIYIFRHGETDWNKERRLQGHTDIPLNDDGRAQAKLLAQILAKQNLQAIITSDLKRAKETAEIVNQDLKLPFFESIELRECRLGDPEGMYREKLIEYYGENSWEQWLSINAEDENFSFPNGESKGEHLKRLINFLELFCNTHRTYQTVAISTHGGSLRRVVHYCHGAPATPVPLPNCALYRLSFNLETKEWHFHGAV